ncbi:hypothetical protein EYR38_002248 [Pleurotus pulmonarius]|nr:hypothetical protein EYR38_002248 [Pleurotus pulmonarius]
MDSSSAMYQEAVKAAVMQIRKGGDKWHPKHWQPPGTVADGLKIYRESIARAYCPAVLAELRSRFEGVGSIFVSGALAGTLASRDQDGPLELPRDIKAHTMLVMVSFLHRTYPVLLRDFLFEVFLPIVHCVHKHLFRVARVFDKTTMPSSIASFRGLRAYILADSQLNVPDGLRFIPLPSPPPPPPTPQKMVLREASGVAFASGVIP